MPRGKQDVPAQPVSAAAGSSGKGGGPATTLITVVLALLLLTVGAAGYEAATLLHDAITAPAHVNGSAASTAAFVCDALKRQDYQQLVTYIDPAPVLPTVTGTFDPRLTIAQLRARDTQEGKVVSCVFEPYAAGSVVSADGAIRYKLTLRRAKAPVSAAGTLILRQRTSGNHGWLIGRESSFLTPTAA